MSPILLLIKQLLLKIVNDIDSGNCDISCEQQTALLNTLFNKDIDLKDQIFSKQAAADYLGISRATFDNKVRDGFLPKGRKYSNFKELIWFKYEIDSFMINQ